MLDLLISYCFYALFLITPLLWFSGSYELFEFNKMIFVYLMTVVVTGVWVLKMLRSRALIFKKSPLDLVMILFLASNLASTYFSIDPHTSIWGYYSRSNGGLLSVISFTLLFFAFNSNLDKKSSYTTLNFGLLGGFLVSLYAIPEHFGISPSCVILHHQLNASCWVQDVQARVFATLGQPNWLAAYLGMLIFPAVYFYLASKKVLERVTFFLLILSYYLAFTFTLSQGATFGFIGGITLLLGTLVFQVGLRRKFRLFSYKSLAVLSLVSVLIFVNLQFGSALDRFNLAQYFTKHSDQPTNKPDTKQQTEKQSPPLPSNVTQLENGGTDSGKIRLIVWKGALNILKNYPIFGTGVETFAYAYYRFRPIEHNLVSEWDFLYNKAHNEYINYLATIGLVGFSIYIFLIASFIFFVLKKIIFSLYKNKELPNYLLLCLFILASYIFFLIEIASLFSVVTTALFFFLFPSLTFQATDSLNDVSEKTKARVDNFLKKKSFFNTLSIVSAILFIVAILGVGDVWFADTLFSKGENYADAGVPTQSYQYLSSASILRPDEPFYKSELGFASASLALLAQDQDATLSAYLKDKAVLETAKALRASPANVSFWRTAVRTYYQLSAIDPKFNDLTIKALDQSIQLAPTDPKIYYNKALILSQLDKTDEAIEVLKKTLELKPNYREAYLTQGELYAKLKKYDQAIESYNIVLKLIPNDPEAQDKIKATEGSISAKNSL